MDENLLTVSEAARLKKVSRSAVYKAISQGRLSARRILGKVAIEQAEVDAWQPFQLIRRRIGIPMSSEVKARISASQKKRWAALRENKK